MTSSAAASSRAALLALLSLETAEARLLQLLLRLASLPRAALAFGCDERRSDRTGDERRSDCKLERRVEPPETEERLPLLPTWTERRREAAGAVPSGALRGPAASAGTPRAESMTRESGVTCNQWRSVGLSAWQMFSEASFRGHQPRTQASPSSDNRWHASAIGAGYLGEGASLARELGRGVGQAGRRQITRVGWRAARGRILSTLGTALIGALGLQERLVRAIHRRHNRRRRAPRAPPIGRTRVAHPRRSLHALSIHLPPRDYGGGHQRGGHQRSSERSSEVIRGHQRSSEGIIEPAWEL